MSVFTADHIVSDIIARNEGIGGYATVKQTAYIIDLARKEFEHENRTPAPASIRRGINGNIITPDGKAVGSYILHVLPNGVGNIKVSWNRDAEFRAGEDRTQMLHMRITELANRFGRGEITQDEYMKEMLALSKGE